MEETSEVIKLNSRVVFCRVGDKRILTVHQKPLYLKKGFPKVNLASAVGKPYGNFLLVKQKEGNVFNLEPLEVGSAKEVDPRLEATGVTRDNRDIVDSSTSQKLTMDEICTRTGSGLLGAEMIDLLVENSATFSSKSEYSQQKYLRKKLEKYSDNVTLMPPSLRLVSEIIFDYDPLSVQNLRPDTLAILLNTAGISCGGKYLVLENGCKGLVTAGVLERLGGEGRLIRITTKKERSGELEAVEKLDLSKNLKQPLISLPLQDLECLNPGFEIPEKDNCFPLAECHVMLKSMGCAVLVKLTENWLREYQVLPDRTHPLVTMSGNSGFLLSGIKVQTSNAEFIYPVGDKSLVEDLDLPDFDKFPKLASATCYKCFLKPGDALFIPSLWYHNVKALDFSVAVNFFWCGMRKELYDAGDPYGNKDPVPVARAAQSVDKAVALLRTLPPKFAQFYGRKLANVLYQKSSEG
ncbi:unnamed protein product [Notodromas monacha]|uniref:tRNA (adenine(58)-N(1))-methyltransferase non-catalytic subunit TRM6 n=1 Tax=Notodromas monacha TaxID=399045 RepID=A0A7R9GIJ1_9CRUS|nr:unnamed protein product [Notodromas monacha]CAG0921829.1 unnamed protein product [Notodromas monacha]